MSDKLDAAERNWKNGDTRSFEFLLLEEVKRLSSEVATLKRVIDEKFAEPA